MRRLAKPLGRKTHVGSNPTPSAPQIFAPQKAGQTRDSQSEFCESPSGGLAEWLNAAVLKTVGSQDPQRFESSTLRHVERGWLV